MAHCGTRHRPLRDVPPTGPRGPQPHRALPDLVEPAGIGQDGRPLLHHAVARGDPRLLKTDDDGRTTEITVVAGELAGIRPLPPPPDSWASRPDADLAIWHIASTPAARWTLPSARSEETARTLYVFEGSMSIGDHTVEAPVGVRLDATGPVDIAAGANGAEALVLQGRPIGEPVVQYGPFVMNDQSGIDQAFSDYQRTGFGGWPWPTDDPVHPRTAGRFALHPDGRDETPGSVVPASEPERRTAQSRT